ncbi:MAG: VOC family protein [Bryobacteraceae bacterium]|nr:VOC family protein [Bryobacteraceae bacterium]
MKRVWAAAILALPLAGQLPPPNQAGVAMGHLHLLVKDVAASRKLWVEGLGATPVMLGPMELLKFPGALVALREGEPNGGTEGSVVNHLGFAVRDLKAAEARWRAAGGEVYERRPQPNQLFLRLPGDVKVELTEDPTLEVPIAHHHVHFYTAAVEEARDWYVKTFGAKAGRRGRFEAADVPGANLSFSPAQEPPGGTKGRALDHIGFEVKGLEAFCKRLEQQGVKFDIPYSHVERLGIDIAFFTDPWGAYIELTEGLDKL